MSPQTETIDSLECVTRTRVDRRAARIRYFVIASLQIIEGTTMSKNLKGSAEVMEIKIHNWLSSSEASRGLR
jgi:hypothetical protein